MFTEPNYGHANEIHTGFFEGRARAFVTTEKGRRQKTIEQSTDTQKLTSIGTVPCGLMITYG